MARSDIVGIFNDDKQDGTAKFADVNETVRCHS